MKYEIWQLKNECHRDYGFMDYDWACKHGFKLSDYEKVYEGEIDASLTCQATAERLFEKFNIARPDDFKGHSLSVSDIVVLGDNKVKLYCDSIGFTLIKE